MNRQCRFAGLVIAGLAFVSTEPALAYTNYNSYVSPYWQILGSTSDVPLAQVTIPSPSCFGNTSYGVRSLTFLGITVFDLSFTSHLANSTTVVADVQLWRLYNTGWMKEGAVKKVWSTIPNNGVYNSVVLPPVNFFPSNPGYYYVTAVIGWWIPPYPGIQAYRQYSFNSASDYFASGNAVARDGWIYLW